jgi:hypothetical protein
MTKRTSVKPARLVSLIAFVLLCPLFVAAAEPSTVWLRIILPESPSPRADAAMAYDPISKKIVLFGGFDATSQLNDTWIWDGAQWTQINTPVAPSGRAGAGMAFDRVTGQVVLFAGFDGTNYLQDTWLWDGATSTWTQASPVASPAPATGPSLFTDPVNGHVDTFGGFNITTRYASSTWQWTGSTWSEIPTPTSPSGRGSAQAVYDPVHKYVVMYGGIADFDPNNTWTFDGSNWTQQNPTTRPAGLMFSSGAFDPVLGQVVLFGGWGGVNAVDLNNTWAWDGSNWVLLKPKHSPSPREFVQMAYDEASHQLISFGGLEIVPKVLLNGTWKLVKR